MRNELDAIKKKNLILEVDNQNLMRESNVLEEQWNQYKNTSEILE